MTERATNPVQERVQAQRKHILGVNGHPPFLELLRVVLQNEQFNVTTTNYVPKTFELIALLQPDLVIVDLVVHQLAGWELLHQLNQDLVTQGIPLLLTSTEPKLLDKAKEAALQYGEHPVLACPFEVADLLKSIDILIGKA
jgi:CheY-like chemotaxis protein